MPSHCWGDDWEHWDLLYKVQNKIINTYTRLTGNQLMCKEKYGTIRYECTFLWIKSPQDALKFCEILRRMVLKYPEVGAEIVDDWALDLDVDLNKDNYSETDMLLLWYKAWFTGVCWGQCQSRWLPEWIERRK